MLESKSHSKFTGVCILTLKNQVTGNTVIENIFETNCLFDKSQSKMLNLYLET